MKAITFEIGAEHFSINISYLKEIKPFDELKNTYVPNSPRLVKGIVNLRGSLVPVLDLGLAFKIESKGINVMILSVKNRVIGILVDAIGSIMDFNEDELDKEPFISSEEKAKYVSGIKRLKDKLLIHLDPETFLRINNTLKTNEEPLEIDNGKIKRMVGDKT